RLTSSVVGNTFTSPRTPWVEEIMPTFSLFSICLSFFFSRERASSSNRLFSYDTKHNFLSYKNRAAAECGSPFSSDDVYIHFLIVFHRRSLYHRADCLCNAALFADHLTHIRGSDMKFQREGLSAFLLRHNHFIRIINKRFRDHFHQIFHNPPPKASQRVAFYFSM